MRFACKRWVLAHIRLCIKGVVAMAIFVIAHSALAEGFVDSRNGGWQGEDVRITCRHGGSVYVAEIVAGQPSLSRDGEVFSFFRTSLLPWGFAMSRHEGEDFTTYAFGFNTRQLNIVRLEGGKIPVGEPPVPRIVRCEKCEEPLADADLSLQGATFKLPGSGWCPEPLSIRDPNMMVYSRFALDPGTRDARDNVLTDAAAENIYMTFVTVGRGDEVSPPVRSFNTLRKFVERALRRRNRTSASDPEWASLLLGPPASDRRYELLDRAVTYTTSEERGCAIVSTKIHSRYGNAERLIDGRRVVCVPHDESGRIIAARFSNTRMTDDPEGKMLLAAWGRLGDRFIESIGFEPR